MQSHGGPQLVAELPQSLKNATASKYFGLSNVRYGSLADISGGLGMSALPPKADMLIVGINVCYVPKADIGLVRTLQTKLQTNCASRPGTGQHRTR